MDISDMMQGKISVEFVKKEWFDVGASSSKLQTTGVSQGYEIFTRASVIARDVATTKAIIAEIEALAGVDRITHGALPQIEPQNVDRMGLLEEDLVGITTHITDKKKELGGLLEAFVMACTDADWRAMDEEAEKLNRVYGQGAEYPNFSFSQNG